MSDSSPPAPAPEQAPGLLQAVGEGIALAFQPVTEGLRVFGEHIIMLFQAVQQGLRPPYRPRLYLEAAEYIGLGSLPLVSLVGAFTGMVTALQAVIQLKPLGLAHLSGTAAGVGLATELGPVLTALMLSGRAGSGIATEIGTMRITEQIDALETMAVSPIQYLVTPRVVMGMLMGPVLTSIFYGIGMAGAYLVAVMLQGVDHGLFVATFKQAVMPIHLMQGCIKALIFGVAFSLIGCYQGFNAAGGGRGVGLATTRAVVAGSVAILVMDYFITDIMLPFMPEAAM